MLDKLTGLNNLEKLAKALDSRSKERDDSIQSAVNLRLVQPDTEGTNGQILSIDDQGNTKWIDNSTPITQQEIDEIMNDVFNG